MFLKEYKYNLTSESFPQNESGIHEKGGSEKLLVSNGFISIFATSGLLWSLVNPFKKQVLNKISQKRLKTISFHSYVGYRTGSNKQTRQMKTQDKVNSLVVTRGKVGRGEVDRDKGVRYMVTEGDLTLGGEHAAQCIDDVL